MYTHAHTYAESCGSKCRIASNKHQNMPYINLYRIHSTLKSHCVATLRMIDSFISRSRLCFIFLYFRFVTLYLLTALVEIFLLGIIRW